MFSKIKHILIDLLRGAATALIMGLLVSVAYGDSLWITLPVAAVFLFIAVLLLQCQRTGRRQLRSITAILLNRSGSDSWFALTDGRDPRYVTLPAHTIMTVII